MAADAVRVADAIEKVQKVCKYVNKNDHFVQQFIITNSQQQSNSKMTRSQGGREHPVFAFKTFAAELLISIIHLLISIKMVLAAIFIDINNSFIDINNSFIDINNSFIDINNSFIDINKDGVCVHLY